MVMEEEIMEPMEGRPEAKPPDFVCCDHGNVVIINAISERAEQWFELHIEEDCPRIGRGVAVEPRYLETLIWGIQESGLTVA